MCLLNLLCLLCLRLSRIWIELGSVRCRLLLWLLLLGISVLWLATILWRRRVAGVLRHLLGLLSLLLRRVSVQLALQCLPERA